MDYVAKEERYDNMIYRRCGRSGLKLPVLSLGLWHNFGSTGVYDNMRAMCRTAFDNGITHFDLANNYGPEYGSAEKNFGRLLKDDLGVYRDEIIVSSKAGYDMWKGPYGDWGCSASASTTSTSSTITAWIPRPRSRRRWAHSQTSFGAEKHFTPASRITTAST